VRQATQLLFDFPQPSPHFFDLRLETGRDLTRQFFESEMNGHQELSGLVV